MICPTNVPRPKRPLHDFVLCFGRYANPALDTVDAGRSSINQSGPLRVLIVEILMRLVGAICNVDLSNFE
jgi:hypothetical protein